MDKTALIEETKKVMGYKEHPTSCEACKFSKEEEVIDRMWETYCTYNNLCAFKVNKNGSCNLFQPKKP